MEKHYTYNSKNKQANKEIVSRLTTSGFIKKLKDLQGLLPSGVGMRCIINESGGQEEFKFYLIVAISELSGETVIANTLRGAVEWLDNLCARLFKRQNILRPFENVEPNKELIVQSLRRLGEVTELLGMISDDSFNNLNREFVFELLTTAINKVKNRCCLIREDVKYQGGLANKYIATINAEIKAASQED